jgi:hypothetical protein
VFARQHEDGSDQQDGCGKNDAKSRSSVHLKAFRILAEAAGPRRGSIDLAVKDIRNLAHFPREFGEFVRNNGLHAVGERLFRLMMDFDQ